MIDGFNNKEQDRLVNLAHRLHATAKRSPFCAPRMRAASIVRFNFDACADAESEVAHVHPAGTRYRKVAGQDAYQSAPDYRSWTLCVSDLGSMTGPEADAVIAHEVAHLMVRPSAPSHGQEFHRALVFVTGLMEAAA
jgi:hypothetical protein